MRSCGVSAPSISSRRLATGSAGALVASAGAAGFRDGCVGSPWVAAPVVGEAVAFGSTGFSPVVGVVDCVSVVGEDTAFGSDDFSAVARVACVSGEAAVLGAADDVDSEVRRERFCVFTCEAGLGLALLEPGFLD